MSFLPSTQRISGRKVDRDGNHIINDNEEIRIFIDSPPAPCGFHVPGASNCTENFLRFEGAFLHGDSSGPALVGLF